MYPLPSLLCHHKMANIFTRPLDLFIVVSFICFSLIAITIDYVQATYGSVLAEEDIEYGVWPPIPIVQSYAWWCETVDDLLAHNPSWYQAMAMFSPFVYFPFYLIAIYAFITEKEWIRLPALMWGTVLVFSLLVIIHEQLWGPYPTKSIKWFIIAYGGYLLVPLLVIVRVIKTPLFPNKENNRSKTAVAKKHEKKQ